MEAGRPGWYDAMNGLPGLFGASMPETYELKRLLGFLLDATEKYGQHSIEIPVEANQLLETVLAALETYENNKSVNRDFVYWDAVSTAREIYRESIQFGINGKQTDISLTDLTTDLRKFIKKVDLGIQRSLELTNDIPTTYFYYQVDEFEFIHDFGDQPTTDSDGRPYIQVKKFSPVALPLFLEGFVRALKVTSTEQAKILYEQVKSSPLFDQKLKMYKVNASLEHQPHDIGRARAFTPGWLENELIWLHMEYKFLLEVLKAGLYDEFFEDFQNALDSIS